MQHAAWRGVWRAAFHGEIRSMLERFSFSSALPLFGDRSRCQWQNSGIGGIARGTAPTSSGSFLV